MKCPFLIPKYPKFKGTSVSKRAPHFETYPNYTHNSHKRPNRHRLLLVPAHQAEPAIVPIWANAER